MGDLADQMKDRRTVVGGRKVLQKIDARMPVGYHVDPTTGYGSATVEVSNEVDPDSGNFDWILDHYPTLSRDFYEVDASAGVEVTSWEMGSTDEHGHPSVTPLFRYKAQIRRRRPGNRLTEDHIKALRRKLNSRHPVAKIDGQGGWLVVNVSDLQLGKADGDGTPGTLDRVRESCNAIKRRIIDCQPDGVVIVDMGDIIENTSCFYPSQAAEVDLNLTDQIKTAIDVMVAFIDAALAAPKVLVGFVPSNHGEPRTGKAATAQNPARDNYDLVVGHAVAKVMTSHTGRYGHVSVWHPPLEHGDPYVLTFDLDGIMVGFTHGHQVRVTGPGRMGALEKWWQSHVWSDRARRKHETEPTIADVDILVTGHGHTLMVSQQSGKVLIQCPALDGGSEHFTTSTGKRSSAGLLTFRVDDRWPAFINDLHLS